MKSKVKELDLHTMKKKEEILTLQASIRRKNKVVRTLDSRRLQPSNHDRKAQLKSLQKNKQLLDAEIQHIRYELEHMQRAPRSTTNIQQEIKRLSRDKKSLLAQVNKNKDKLMGYKESEDAIEKLENELYIIRRERREVERKLYGLGKDEMWRNLWEIEMMEKMSNEGSKKVYEERRKSVDEAFQEVLAVMDRKKHDGRKYEGNITSIKRQIDKVFSHNMELATRIRIIKNYMQQQLKIKQPSTVKKVSSLPQLKKVTKQASVQKIEESGEKVENQQVIAIGQCDDGRVEVIGEGRVGSLGFVIEGQSIMEICEVKDKQLDAQTYTIVELDKCASILYHQHSPAIRFLLRDQTTIQMGILPEPLTQLSLKNTHITKIQAYFQPESYRVKGTKWHLHSKPI